MGPERGGRGNPGSEDLGVSPGSSFSAPGAGRPGKSWEQGLGSESWERLPGLGQLTKSCEWDLGSKSWGQGQGRFLRTEVL